MKILLITGVLAVLALTDITSAAKVPSNVLDLNDKFLDVMNEGFWMVKFYAPWCGHCKRIAPIWEHVGHALADMNSPVRIGKIDCTRFTAVANSLRINAYPTIMFFRNGNRIPYEGERKKEAILDFLIKSSGPVVAPLDTAVKYSELRKTSDKDPFFVYVDSEANSINEDQLFKNYEAAAEKLFTESRFFRSKTLTPFPASVVLPQKPAILVFKDGKHYIYDETKNPDLAGWIESERWPLITAVTPANIHALGKADKKLVLIISDLLDRSNLSSEAGKYFKMAKEAANLCHQDEDLHSKFQFGWLDGNAIANNIVMGEMAIPCYALLVFNDSSYEYFLPSDAPEKTTPQSIITFLQTIASDTVEPMGGRTWPLRFRRMYYDITTNVYQMFQAQPVLTICLFGVPMVFIAVITYSICSADFTVDRDEIYPEEEDYSDSEMIQEKENDASGAAGGGKGDIRKRKQKQRRRESERSLIEDDDEEEEGGDEDDGDIDMNE
uniref:Thioredoxin domain-containing protein n=1 Tax=Panagrolaimus sp. ES5 TaxID=591445 RepID=A0AC34G110_9BILA